MGEHMGREFLAILESMRELDEVREICKRFFLSREYRIIGESSDLIVFKGGDLLWTLLGTYRWYKIMKTLAISLQRSGNIVKIKLNYDISYLALIFPLIKTIRKEIEELAKNLDAKILKLKGLGIRQ
ncbi:MAG: hypothetical protein DRN64_03550 [Thaumarchaeota archaeon]|nr:MAG: hypothetical protein DRN64_03550 [Nitrososphaerota archaeon]